MGGKTVFTAGILAWIAMLAISIAIGALTSSLYLDSPAMWKPMGMLWFVGIVLLNLMVGLIYAVVYTVVGRPLVGSPLAKGLLYGSLIWFIGPLPGLMMTHLTMAVSPELVITWLFTNLINALVAGVIVAYVFDFLGGMKKTAEVKAKGGRKRGK